MYPNQSNALMGGGGGGGGTVANPPDIHMDSMQNSPQQQQQNMNYNGMQQQPQQTQQVQQAPQQPSNAHKKLTKKAYVRIVEQPAGKALRFRYECEGRSAGSIPGVNSTSETKTFPTIEIVGYKGRAVVVVSCVTKDAPHRPHPHNLVGKEGCKKGVCTLEINSETMRAVFSNLGIQCVKKKDIEAALKAREDIRVDPYKTGFSHRFQPTTIDLNSVRLCFQVFLEGEKGRFTVPLAPVISEPIFDKKAMSDLVICHLCSCSASVLGNTQIILLCEKVAKEDIMVRFYEEKNGQVIWQAYGDFQHTDVHKQVAIKFKTPKYRTLDITEPAKVFIQLQRPSDGAVSEPLPFEYVPLDSDPEHLRRKRQRTGGDPTHLLMQQQQKQNQNNHQGGPTTLTSWNAPNIPPIKTEPRDASPQPFNMYRPQTELTPSPQPLSPPNNYNHNTPSPYSMATGGGAGVGVPVNTPLMSPNHHYRAGDATNTGATPTPVDALQHDYHVFGGGGGGVGGQPHHSPHHQQHHQQQQQHTSPQHHQQHHHPHQQQQQQQHHQQQQHQPPQQPYYGNPFVDISQWEEKFANVLASANANANLNANANNPNNTGNAMNNLSATNPFNVQTLLAASVAAAAAGGGVVAGDMPPHSQWNFPPNQMDAQMQQHNLQSQSQPQHQKLQQTAQTQQQQQQQSAYPQAAHNNNMNIVEPASGVTNANADDTNNIGAASNNSEQGPTISNLLNFDSGQLVHINSEDQQMLRLTSDDLQLSNLSIST